MGLSFFARGAFTALSGYFRKPLGTHHASIMFFSGTPATTRVTKYSQCASKNAPGEFVCYQLTHRTLLKIQGQDITPFLQGLMTNDIGLFEEAERTAMHTHMLNVQGRTLYDLILYSLEEKGSPALLVECDNTLKDSILKHLNMYKLRRKVCVSSCPELSVWAVLSLQNNPNEEISKPELSVPEKALAWEADPRTPFMGWRLVLSNQTDPTDVVKSCQKRSTKDYHRHRYSIGLPEGIQDLPPGVALPLESNLVYLQGISFSKGCYIGQELTARTHHTGVIRKRLMPVRLSSPVQDVKEGTALLTQSGKPAGKYRAGLEELGLSLIRLAHANEVLTLQTSDGTTVTLEVSVPDWWPKDVKKS